MKKKFLFVSVLLMSSAALAGAGGNLKIFNYSSYPMEKSYEHSYQMAKWSLPNTIAASDIPGVYVEFSNSFGQYLEDDAADTTYSIKCPNGAVDKVTFMARVLNAYSGAYALYIKQDGWNCVHAAPESGLIGWPSKNGTVSGTITNNG